MQKAFFNFESWDVLEAGVYIYYEITLNTSMGNFSTGDRFHSAVMNYQEGTLTLTRKGKAAKFNLVIKVKYEVRDEITS